MEDQLQDGSNFNLLALAVLVMLGYLTWSLPRRYAICPLLIMTCLMPWTTVRAVRAASISISHSVIRWCAARHYQRRVWQGGDDSH